MALTSCLGTFLFAEKRNVTLSAPVASGSVRGVISISIWTFGIPTTWSASISSCCMVFAAFLREAVSWAAVLSRRAFMRATSAVWRLMSSSTFSIASKSTLSFSAIDNNSLMEVTLCFCSSSYIILSLSSTKPSLVGSYSTLSASVSNSASMSSNSMRVLFKRSANPLAFSKFSVMLSNASIANLICCDILLSSLVSRLRAVNNPCLISSAWLSICCSASRLCCSSSCNCASSICLSWNCINSWSVCPLVARCCNWPRAYSACRHCPYKHL